MNRSSSTLVFRIAMGTLMAVLVFALFRTQVIRGEYYKGIAEANFVRIRRVVATRGEIYDRKYRAIATNIPSHNLYLTSGKIGNTERLAAFLTAYFGLDSNDLHKMIFEQRFKTYEEILLADNIPYETVLTLSERLDQFPELNFRIGTTRSYIYSNHFTGYVGRINEEEYQRYLGEDYSLNAYIGKTGLERYYEVLLRGKDGKEILQVDSKGKSLEFFKDNISVPPKNGLSLVLSIDNDLQSYAEEVFPKGVKGTVIVTDIKTGGILAYLSKPDFNPNVFMNKISPEVWASLNTADKPLLDRNIQAAYPPGSVFKPITGSKGLETGVINRYTRLAPCTGGLRIGNRFFKCWTHTGHGSLDIVNAHRVSCDVYFYDLINKMDLDAVYEHALKCGVVNKTGIDLPNERNGFYPNTDWYHKKLNLRSGLNGYKANLAIGQGEVLTTPLQINTFYAAIARNGLWIQPHLLLSTVGANRITREQVQPLIKRHLPWSKTTMEVIHDALWAVTNAPGGTARAINVPGTTTYGKTGSAENSMGKMTHAWFSGYIVTDKPEIVVTVFMENAGGGGGVCAPVANKIFNYYIGNIDKIKAPAPIPMQFRTEADNAQEPDPTLESPTEEVAQESAAGNVD